jgi:hypothetical protein
MSQLVAILLPFVAILHRYGSNRGYRAMSINDSWRDALHVGACVAGLEVILIAGRVIGATGGSP